MFCQQCGNKLRMIDSQNNGTEQRWICDRCELSLHVNIDPKPNATQNAKSKRRRRIMPIVAVVLGGASLLGTIATAFSHRGSIDSKLEEIVLVTLLNPLAWWGAWGVFRLATGRPLMTKALWQWFALYAVIGVGVIILGVIALMIYNWHLIRTGQF